MEEVVLVEWVEKSLKFMLYGYKYIVKGKNKVLNRRKK